jgi:serine/threonine protein kinase
MLVGEAPFAGEYEEDIFDSIVSDDIEFPYTMSETAVNFVNKLLQKNPLKRLGAGPNDALDVRRHRFFQGVEWEKLLQKQLDAPFVPPLGSDRDVSQFDEQFTRNKPGLSPAADTPADVDKRFAGFSFTVNWLGRRDTEV